MSMSHFLLTNSVELLCHRKYAVEHYMKIETQCNLSLHDR